MNTREYRMNSLAKKVGPYGKLLMYTKFFYVFTSIHNCLGHTMKKIVLFVCTFPVVVTTAVANDICVDSLASYSPVGPATGPILKVINSTSQLYEYCKAIDFNTSLLSTQSDFTSKTVIGLRTMTCGGNRIDYQILKRVYNDNDSVILEVKPDSQVFDVGMSMQAASHVLIFAIPKTDNPVVIKIEQTTNVKQLLNRSTVLCSVQSQKICSYSLLGRSLSSKSKHPCWVVISSGEQNGGKLTIVQRTEKK